jgi:hypothetical protein
MWRCGDVRVAVLKGGGVWTGTTWPEAACVWAEGVGLPRYLSRPHAPIHWSSELKDRIPTTTTMH